MRKLILISLIALLLFLAACSPKSEPPQRINFENSTYTATNAVLMDPSTAEDSGYKVNGFKIYVDKNDTTHLAIFIKTGGKFYIWVKEGALPQEPQ